MLTNPQDGDVGSIMGLGFAPQTGGAISLIDQVGIKTFVAECDELAKKYGAQFEVPKLLRDMAAKGESFYGKHHPQRRPDRSRRHGVVGLAGRAGRPHPRSVRPGGRPCPPAHPFLRGRRVRRHRLCFSVAPANNSAGHSVRRKTVSRPEILCQ